MSALGASLVLASLLATEPVTSAEARREVDEIFAQDRYYFCQPDNDYEPNFGNDALWCDLAEESHYRSCKGYEKVCARARAAEFEWGQGGSSGERGEEGEKDKVDELNPGAKKEEDKKEFRLPDLGGFARVLMWLLLIGIVIFVVAAIAKNLVKDDDEDDGPELDLDEDEASRSLIAARAEAMRIVETDVQRLLARAEAAAARGDHESAINDAHAALLRRLEGEHLIAVDRWKTNGDYIAALRDKPGLRDEVREVVRAVEQVQFGSAEPSAGRYSQIRAKVLAIVGRAVVAVALAVGLGAGTACDPDERPDSSALAGLGNGPSGQRAIGELLLGFDIEARHRARTLEQLTQIDGAIVLLDDVDLHDEDWDQLLPWVEQGGMLVIATGREFPREVRVDYDPQTREATQLEHDDHDWYFQHLGVAAPPGRTLRAQGFAEELLVRPVDAQSPDYDPWAYESQAQPYVLRRDLGEGQIVVFAESDMFTNAGLIVRDNAAFLVNLFRSADVEEVEFIDGFTGAGADNPFESVANAKLGALFLQVLLFLIVLYAAVGIPFARLRDPLSRRRRAFAEHVRTLGQRYAQARAARYVAGLYSAWVLDRLRERLQPGGARGLHPLAQALAARTGRDEGEIMQILVEAHSLREPDAASSRGGPRDLELMRALAKLLEQTGGVR